MAIVKKAASFNLSMLAGVIDDSFNLSFGRIGHDCVLKKAYVSVSTRGSTVVIPVTDKIEITHSINTFGDYSLTDPVKITGGLIPSISETEIFIDEMKIFINDSKDCIVKGTNELFYTCNVNADITVDVEVYGTIFIELETLRH